MYKIGFVIAACLLSLGCSSMVIHTRIDLPFGLPSRYSSYSQYEEHVCSQPHVRVADALDTHDHSAY